MKLKLDKPTLKWAFVKGKQAYICPEFTKGKPTAWLAKPGETIERVPATVTRVPAKRGKHADA